MNDKVVVIHQPDFSPYLGFFDRLLNADIYVVLDNVQFVRGTTNSWQYRDKIKTPTGEQWINVGVKKCPLNTLINQVELQQDPEWRVRMKNLIVQNYSKANYFKEIMPHMEEVIFFPSFKMDEFNFNSIKKLLELLNIEIEIKWASQLGVSGKSNELVAKIVREVGATKYLSGTGALAYYDPEVFQHYNVEVKWQNFNHPVYSQIHGAFLSYLTSFDLLLNCGIEESRFIIRKEK